MTLKQMDSILPLVYGPVQSRRHGRSLGLNLGKPGSKECTWSCLYCQCGFGTRTDHESTSLTPKEIAAQVKAKLFEVGPVDAITIAGNTEPGLYPQLKELIRQLKILRYASRGAWKILILSNGSELDSPQVQDAFSRADQAWLKLDAASEGDFARLSRPLRGGLKEHIVRLKQMKPLRVQTLLWGCSTRPELSNSHPAQVAALVDLLGDLRPLAVRLYTLDREPAFSELEPVEDGVLDGMARELRARGIEVEWWPSQVAGVASVT
jgi:wyosine [tRNA(Phe)-imidazoG37] synthetase (radical SAM superfamily)